MLCRGSAGGLSGSLLLRRGDLSDPPGTLQVTQENKEKDRAVLDVVDADVIRQALLRKYPERSPGVRAAIEVAALYADDLVAGRPLAHDGTGHAAQKNVRAGARRLLRSIGFDILPVSATGDAARARQDRPDLCPRPDKKVLNQQQAHEAAKEHRARNHRDIEAYRCMCGAWHIGKSGRRLNQRMRYALHYRDRTG